MDKRLVLTEIQDGLGYGFGEVEVKSEGGQVFGGAPFVPHVYPSAWRIWLANKIEALADWVCARADRDTGW